MKRPCVEFYIAGSTLYRSDAKTFEGNFRKEFGWRLRAKNGQIILTPHETFVSHRNAVESFRRVADALDMQGVVQIEDLEGVSGSVEMLCR